MAMCLRKQCILASLVAIQVLFFVVTSFAQDIGPVALGDSRSFQAAAEEAYKQGSVRRAKVLYERALFLDGDNAVVLNDLGLVNEELGLLEEAEANYLKAIELDFKFLPAYSNLGALYRSQGLNDKAMYYLERRAQYGSPSDKWTLEAEDHLGKVKRQTAATTREILEIDKKILENSMTLRYKERERTSAAGMLRKAEAYYQQGLVAFKARDYKTAVNSFDACLKDNPYHPIARHMLWRTKFLLSSTGSVQAPKNTGMKVSGN